MPNENATMEQRLNKLSVEKLSGDERERLWTSVVTAHADMPRAVPSPFFSSWSFNSLSITRSYSMITAAVTLLIALSAGATVAVADNSRPGDALFALDRAAENVRIAFAGDDKKDELRVRFAHERAQEFEEIVEEESENIRLARAQRDSSGSAPAAEVSLMMATEADVSAKIAEDAGGDDSSDDSGDDASKSEARIANGLSVALSYLSEVSNELSAKGNVEAQAAIDEVIARLNSKLSSEDMRDFNIRFEGGDDNGVRAEFRSSGEVSGGGGIEVRGDGVKTKIEFEDGRVKFETETEMESPENPRDFPDDLPDDFDDDSDDDSDDTPAPTSADVEIEADTFLDLTIVKVEQNDQKQSFTTTARTRADIVAAIVDELGMAEADVDAALQLETENRTSRPEDLMWSGPSRD